MTFTRPPRITLLMLGLAGLIPALAACASAEAQTPKTDTAAVGALAQRAQLAAARSFTGTYAVSGTAATVRVWVTPTAYRVEVAQGTSTAALYGSASGTVACPENAGMPTVCYTVAGPGKAVPTAFDAGIERVFTRDLPALAAAAPGFTVTEEQPAPALAASSPGVRCFTVTQQPGGTVLTSGLVPLIDAGTYCLSPDGLPVQLGFTSGTLTLVSHGEAPPPVALRVPAPPQALPPGMPTAVAPSPKPTLPKAFG